MAFEWAKSDWFMRRKAGALLARVERDPNPGNLDALEKWRKADPRHATILRQCEAVLSQSQRLPSAKDIGTSRRRVSPTSAHASAVPVAASIAFFAVGAAVLYAFMASPMNHPVEAVLLSTSVGEIREIPLRDGSKVTLDTQSSVRVEIGRDRRQALVERGRARFTIAGRNIPFTIRSGSTAVRMDKGIVDVSSVPQQPRVELIKGDATVSENVKAGLPTLAIHAPAALNASGADARPTYAAQASNWTNGQLSFANASLGEVISAANRYTGPQILLDDRSIADLKVTGVYKTGDAQGLAKSLAAAFGLAVRRDAAGNFILARPNDRH